jgi:hypothetical protein
MWALVVDDRLLVEAFGNEAGGHDLHRLQVGMGHAQLTPGEQEQAVPPGARADPGRDPRECA